MHREAARSQAAGGIKQKIMDRRLLTRVVLRNYKSIAACDVSPAQLSFLVGPNGSGKSNFLDALRFVADSLRFSLDHAFRDRGGINEVRRRSGGRPTPFGIRVEFNLAESRGHYAFTVGARKQGGYGILARRMPRGSTRWRRLTLLPCEGWRRRQEYPVSAAGRGGRSPVPRQRFRGRCFSTRL